MWIFLFTLTDFFFIYFYGLLWRCSKHVREENFPSHFIHFYCFISLLYSGTFLYTLIIESLIRIFMMVKVRELLLRYLRTRKMKTKILFAICWCKINLKVLWNIFSIIFKVWNFYFKNNFSTHENIFKFLFSNSRKFLSVKKSFRFFPH